MPALNYLGPLVADLYRPAPPGLPRLEVALESKRHEFEMSRHEFAKLIGMQPSNYYEFLKGKRMLPITAVRKAYRIGISADVLLLNS